MQRGSRGGSCGVGSAEALVAVGKLLLSAGTSIFASTMPPSSEHSSICDHMSQIYIKMILELFRLTQYKFTNVV